MPDGIDDETACQLIAMPLSAKMVLADLGLQRGDWLVQNSANGAVGRLLSRFGAEKGVNVLSLVRRDAAIAELAAVGITNVVSTEQPGWEARPRPCWRWVNPPVPNGNLRNLTSVMPSAGTTASFHEPSGLRCRQLSRQMPQASNNDICHNHWSSRSETKHNPYSRRADSSASESCREAPATFTLANLKSGSLSML